MMARLMGFEPISSGLEPDILAVELSAHIWCLRPGLNGRPPDFQSGTLPTELHRHIWWGETESNRPNPKVTVLQTAPLPLTVYLPIESDHQSLSTLVPCYLVVWVGDVFEFLSPLEPLKLYEGVARSEGFEPS